jgi:hypothetical protein
MPFNAVHTVQGPTEFNAVHKVQGPTEFHLHNRLVCLSKAQLIVFFYAY